MVEIASSVTKRVKLSQTQQNDGRFFGWDAHHHEHLGTTEDVKFEPFNNGVDSDQHCLKFTQTYDPEYRGRYHSEVVLHDATQHGDTKYFGFAFKIAEDWEFMEGFHSPCVAAFYACSFVLSSTKHILYAFPS